MSAVAPFRIQRSNSQGPLNDGAPTTPRRRNSLRAVQAPPPPQPSVFRDKFLCISVLICVVSVGLIVAGLSSADWVSFNLAQESTRLGLARSCTGATCTPVSFAGNFSVATGCTKQGSDVKDRLDTTLGLIIIAIIIAFGCFLYQILAGTNCWKIGYKGNTYMSVVFFLTSAIVLISVAIFGGTFNSFIGCGEDYCSRFRQTTTWCGYGYSFVFVIVASVVLMVDAVIVLLYAQFPKVIYPSNDAILGASSLTLFAIILMIIGISTPNWIVLAPSNVRLGMYSSCVGLQQCTEINFDGDKTTRATCTISGTVYKGRVAVSTALLATGALINFILLVIYFFRMMNLIKKQWSKTAKKVTIFFVAISFGCQLVGIILFANTVNNYMFCGQTVCQATGDWSCGFGFSAGFVIVAVTITALLIFLHIAEHNDWLCFQSRYDSGVEKFNVQAAVLKKPPPVRVKPEKPKKTTIATQDENAPVDWGKDEPPSAPPPVLPPGDWVFDPQSELYWGAEYNLFYDPPSRNYYDPATDNWIPAESE